VYLYPCNLSDSGGEDRVDGREGERGGEREKVREEGERGRETAEE